jgi:hypothetical protein
VGQPHAHRRRRSLGRDAAAQYLAIGYLEGTTFHHLVQAGGQHNEIYWAERLPGALQFLYGPRAP